MAATLIAETTRLLDLVYVDKGEERELYFPVCVLGSCTWALIGKYEGAKTVGGVTRPVMGPASCASCGAKL